MSLRAGLEGRFPGPANGQPNHLLSGKAHKNQLSGLRLALQPLKNLGHSLLAPVWPPLVHLAGVGVARAIRRRSNPERPARKQFLEVPADPQRGLWRRSRRCPAHRHRGFCPSPAHGPPADVALQGVAVALKRAQHAIRLICQNTPPPKRQHHRRASSPAQTTDWRRPACSGTTPGTRTC